MGEERPVGAGEEGEGDEGDGGDGEGEVDEDGLEEGGAAGVADEVEGGVEGVEGEEGCVEEEEEEGFEGVVCDADGQVGAMVVEARAAEGARGAVVNARGFGERAAGAGGGGGVRRGGWVGGGRC